MQPIYVPYDPVEYAFELIFDYCGQIDLLLRDSGAAIMQRYDANSIISALVRLERLARQMARENLTRTQPYLPHESTNVPNHLVSTPLYEPDDP